MPEQTTWLALVVDDDNQICEDIKEFLESEETAQGDRVSVTATTSFEEGMYRLESGRFDIGIVDLREGDHDLAAPESEAGEDFVDTLKKTRFIPM